MAGETGFEPVTITLTEYRSNQLSYTPIKFNLAEEVGFEPTVVV